MLHPCSLVLVAVGCSHHCQSSTSTATANICIPRHAWHTNVILTSSCGLPCLFYYACIGLPILQYVPRDDRTRFLEGFVELGMDERNIVAANNAYLAEEARSCLFCQMARNLAQGCASAFYGACRLRGRRGSESQLSESMVYIPMPRIFRFGILRLGCHCCFVYCCCSMIVQFSASLSWPEAVWNQSALNPLLEACSLLSWTPKFQFCRFCMERLS